MRYTGDYHNSQSCCTTVWFTLQHELMSSFTNLIHLKEVIKMRRIYFWIFIVIGAYLMQSIILLEPLGISVLHKVILFLLGSSVVAISVLELEKERRRLEKIEEMSIWKMIFPMIGSERLYLANYVFTASAVMTLVILLQYYRHQIFGTTLFLGYDSPAYVWLAKDIIIKGSIYMARFWCYPHLYVQLLAFFGYLSGNIVAVERILPLLFGALLIYTNTKLVFRVEKNVHIAGLAAFLTAISINVLKILSDFHRNLMAFSLASIVLLLVADIDDERPLLNKKYLSLILILAAIATTHFETYFILFICLALYGCLIKNPKKLFMLGLACAVPLAILIPSFPGYFLGYVSRVTPYTHELTLNEIVQWTGGSWILFLFSILGAIYLFHKTMQRNDKLAPLIFSWFLATILIVFSIQLTHIVPTFYSLRTLLITPVPVLLALSIPACNHLVKIIRSKQKSSAKHSTPLYVKVLLFFLALCLIEGSMITVFRSCDYFLTPHISHSSYEKILTTKNFLTKKDLSKPVVVFRGDPPIRFVELYRNYLGMELGEHFAYYGDIENLFLLAPSEPRIKHDEYLSERERHFLNAYYNELLGNYSELPAIYPHESYIKDVKTLISHPILIITPDFYKEEIPCYIKSFHIGEGIYIVPPDTLITQTN